MGRKERQARLTLINVKRGTVSLSITWKKSNFADMMHCHALLTACMTSIPQPPLAEENGMTPLTDKQGAQREDGTQP